MKNNYLPKSTSKTFLACALFLAGFSNNNKIMATLTVSTSITNNVSCNGGSNGSMSAIASGGTCPYTYSWSNSATTSNISGLTAGNYTITVTDHWAHTATASATITQPSALSVTASTSNSTVCAGNSVTISASVSGGTVPYTYDWIPNVGLSCSNCASSLAYPFGDPYTVTVSDNQSCSSSDWVGIFVYPLPFPVITSSGSEPICTGAIEMLSAAGATTYLWNTGATTCSISITVSAPTTYTVTGTNTFGCTNSAIYTVDTSCTGTGNGINSANAILIAPSDSCKPISYSTLTDTALWFSFYPSDSCTQICVMSNIMGLPVPHVHVLKLYNSSMQTIEEEDMPDETGANELRIDQSHLVTGSGQYYIYVARTPSHANMPGCNPTPSPTGVCNSSMPWSFQLCVRSVHVLIPPDSGNEPPSISQLYYENRGQIAGALVHVPLYNIKAYTNWAKTGIYCQDSLISFLLGPTPSINSVHRVDMVLTGSSLSTPQRVFKTGEDTDSYLNYFLGYVPNGITNVYGYSRLVYKNVYPNIDEELYSNGMGAKIYFISRPSTSTLHPAGNPANIQIEFRGATSVNVTVLGGLIVTTDLGTLSFPPAFAYEDSLGIIKTRGWQAKFVAINSNTVGFFIGPYNNTLPLIIRMDRGKGVATLSASCNQNLCWSTYTGGKGITGYSANNDVAHDATGNIYVTGYTQSNNFPFINGAYQTNLNGAENVQIFKFSNTVKDSMLWATYYGGSDSDVGTGIGADAAGNVYVTGYTNSPDFPKFQLSGAYWQPLLNGNGLNNYTDAFIIKLPPNGGAMHTPIPWATFYGGPTIGEQANHLVLDGNNNLYIVGWGSDSNTPVYLQSGAYNFHLPPTKNGGFILKFTTNGVQEWATDIEGYLFGCTVDENNNLYVAGEAYNTIYPVTAKCKNFVGGSGFSDACATEFNTADTIVWSTCYGGDGNDVAYSITVGQQGSACITGITHSPESSLNIQLHDPHNGAYYQPTNGNGTGDVVNPEGFIAEFAPDSGTIVWGTYFGGLGDMFPKAITVDVNENLYITGYVDNGLPYPVSNPATAYVQSSSPGGVSYQCFIADFNHRNYTWGTYFGGGGNGYSDFAYGITDVSGSNLYIVGGTQNWNPNFPLVMGPPGSWNEDSLPSGYSAFVSQFGLTVLGIENIKNPTHGEVLVYPNPSLNNITVQMELDEQGNVEFYLYNLIGEKVYSKTVMEQPGIITQKISLNLLPDGPYILMVTDGDMVYHQKIIKLQ